MGDKTGIQWTEATWNPVTGCTKVSPGCAHCYAETVTRRFARAWGVSDKPWTPENAAEVVRIRPDRLDQPLRWTRPRLVFVNSMSDLFHEQVPDWFIREVFAITASAPQHTFQVLTKRPERARELLADRNALVLVARQAALRGLPTPTAWPLPNVWVGVSIENARHAYRADVLREIPAAVRFISAEPLLGPLVETLVVDGIDWMIVGGESGPRARPMLEEWARELVHDCRSEGVACFVKQLGTVWAREHGARDRKGGNPDEWPHDLRVREMPR